MWHLKYSFVFTYSRYFFETVGIYASSRRYCVSIWFDRRPSILYEFHSSPRSSNFLYRNVFRHKKQIQQLNSITQYFYNTMESPSDETPSSIHYAHSLYSRIGIAALLWPFFGVPSQFSWSLSINGSRTCQFRTPLGFRIRRLPMWIALSMRIFSLWYSILRTKYLEYVFICIYASKFFSSQYSTEIHHFDVTCHNWLIYYIYRILKFFLFFFCVSSSIIGIKLYMHT